jgi:U3 small nucleolar RNA-associated protein 18
LSLLIVATLQVIVAGARSYFYYYDVESGAVQKVPQVFSAGGRHESLLRTFAASRCGQWIAFVTSAGYIMLISNKTKQWAADFKVNGTVQAVTFSHDSQYLVASGRDSELYKFDIRSKRCVLRMYNEVSPYSL